MGLETIAAAVLLFSEEALPRFVCCDWLVGCFRDCDELNAAVAVVVVV